MKVLVVDDEPQIRRALRTSLEAHGYEVAARWAPARKASSARPRSSPDLVLLDLGLPDMDGTEVIAPDPRRSPMCRSSCVSVREEPADKVAALDAGADDYVTKPFGMEELLARGRAALRRTATEEPARAGPALRRPRGRPRDAGW